MGTLKWPHTRFFIYFFFFTPNGLSWTRENNKVLNCGLIVLTGLGLQTPPEAPQQSPALTPWICNSPTDFKGKEWKRSKALSLDATSALPSHDSARPLRAVKRPKGTTCISGLGFSTIKVLCLTELTTTAKIPFLQTLVHLNQTIHFQWELCCFWFNTHDLSMTWTTRILYCF